MAARAVTKKGDMGVYIFKSLHGPWIKIGHHRITPRRPNVYYRVAGRGFCSCVHPPELCDHLSMDDFLLIAWYPELDRRCERLVHRACSVSVGEFHADQDVERAMACADALGRSEPVDDAAREEARSWAHARGRGAFAR